MAGHHGRQGGSHPFCVGGGGRRGGGDHPEQQAVLCDPGPGRIRRETSAGTEEGGEGEQNRPSSVFFHVPKYEAVSYFLFM